MLAAMNFGFFHDPSHAAVWLWVALGLFVLRVVGQVLVVTVQPRWLPPMGQWQSGLLPYPVLLVSQAAIIALLATVAMQFSRGVGWSVEAPHPRIGAALVVLACIYLAGMAYRYARRMSRLPDQRWFGGTIPIAFHCVLASFLLTVGLFYVA
jgi:hypothetical protein